VATARCSAYCVFAQRFSIQPLGSLRWPEAQQKHTPQVKVRSQSSCSQEENIAQVIGVTSRTAFSFS